MTAEFNIFILPADCGVWTHPHFYTDLRPWPTVRIIKIQTGFTFLYRLTQVVLEKRPSNGSVRSTVSRVTNVIMYSVSQKKQDT